MAKKIYLSAAAHATDNPTKCTGKCGENVHCNAYMDIVEKRLKQHGIEVKRGNPDKTGRAEMLARVKEANAWGADLYYVSHTNAGGGRYSLTLCYDDAASIALANVIHKYRKCVDSHKVRTRTDLMEINSTKMPCLYDELFFHDNAEDCAWFHNGGMKQLAEETVQALCEILGVAYKAETATKDETDTKPTSTTKAAVNKGDLVSIKKGATYYSGKAIPSWVAGMRWYVDSVSGNRAVINKSEDGKYTIMSPISTSNITVVKAAKKDTTAIKKGDLVAIKAGAKYYSGGNIPAWVSKQRWYVADVKGDRAVIDKSEDGKNSIMSPIKVSNLTKVK